MYHHIISSNPWRSTTSSKSSYRLVRLSGQSVYWQRIFQTSDDPTFVFLTILWLVCILFMGSSIFVNWCVCDHHTSPGVLPFRLVRVIMNQALWVLMICIKSMPLLHYESCLDDFHKSERLTNDRKMLQERLTNIIQLVSSVRTYHRCLHLPHNMMDVL